MKLRQQARCLPCDGFLRDQPFLNQNLRSPLAAIAHDAGAAGFVSTGLFELDHLIAVLEPERTAVNSAVNLVADHRSVLLDELLVQLVYHSGGLVADAVGIGEIIPGPSQDVAPERRPTDISPATAPASGDTFRA